MYWPCKIAQSRNAHTEITNNVFNQKSYDTLKSGSKF